MFMHQAVELHLYKKPHCDIKLFTVILLHVHAPGSRTAFIQGPQLWQNSLLSFYYMHKTAEMHFYKEPHCDIK